MITLDDDASNNAGVTSRTAGVSHMVLLHSNGTAIAIGDNSYEQTAIPPLPAGTSYTQVSAGEYHTVLLTGVAPVTAL